MQTIENEPLCDIESASGSLFKNKYGLEVLEDFIKQQKKPPKRQRGRKASGLITGASVYYEMFGLKIDDNNARHLFTSVDQKIIIT